MNRADPDLLSRIYGVYGQPLRSRQRRVRRTQLQSELGQELLDNCFARRRRSAAPLYKDGELFSGIAIISHKSTSYFPYCTSYRNHRRRVRSSDSEVNRENVRKLEAYVEEMASADQISGSVNIQKIQDDVVKLWNVVKSQPEISEEQKNRIKALYDGVVRSLRKAPDSRPRPGVPRSRRSSSQFLRPQISSITSRIG